MAEEGKPPAYEVFADPLNRWDTSDLQQAAKDIDDLVNHPGYRAMHRLVGEVRERGMARLIHGRNLALEEYTATTSLLSGLDQLIRIPDCVAYAAEMRDEQEAAAARDAAQQEARTA